LSFNHIAVSLQGQRNINFERTNWQIEECN